MPPGSMNQRLTRSFLIDCPAAGVMGPPLVAQMAAAGQFSKLEPSKATTHTLRRIDGWTVRVDDRLFAPPDTAEGTQAQRFLDDKLSDIREVVTAKPLAKRHYFRGVQAQRPQRSGAPVRRFSRQRFLPLQPGRVDDGCAGGLRTDASDMGPVADNTAVPSRKGGHRRREFIGLGEVAPATTGNLLPTDREDTK